MASRLAFWYGIAFLAASIVLAGVGWLIGGTAGVFVWIGGFLIFWAATRAANRLFGGFLLGDDRGERSAAWDPSSPCPHEQPDAPTQK